MLLSEIVSRRLNWMEPEEEGVSKKDQKISRDETE